MITAIRLRDGFRITWILKVMTPNRWQGWWVSAIFVNWRVPRFVGSCSRRTPHGFFLQLVFGKPEIGLWCENRPNSYWERLLKEACGWYVVICRDKCHTGFYCSPNFGLRLLNGTSPEIHLNLDKLLNAWTGESVGMKNKEIAHFVSVDIFVLWVGVGEGERWHID